MITILSPITAPAATKLPDSIVACLTVAPIATNDQSETVDPCKIQFGPINTLFPILTYFEICARSCTTVFSPIDMGFVPIIVAPYQTEEFMPKLTLPSIVALGAIKSAFCI